MTDQTTNLINGIHTVGVPVTDQDRVLDFYAGTLGLEVRLDGAFGDGGRWIEVAPAGATTTVALIRASDAVPAGVETGVRLTSADVDAIHRHLSEAGVDADEVLRWPGAPAMFASGTWTGTVSRSSRPSDPGQSPRERRRK